jgi:predicted acylesterase/phospholipase RssA
VRRANYHWGVLLALRDAACLPTCIAGTSAGSAVAAVVCTRTEKELEEEGVLESTYLVHFLQLFK